MALHLLYCSLGDESLGSQETAVGYESAQEVSPIEIFQGLTGVKKLVIG